MQTSNIEKELTALASKDLATLTDEEWYNLLLSYQQEKLKETPTLKGNKKLYYISAEFLIGKLLTNNFINLHLYDEVDTLLKKYNKTLSTIEAYEPEPSLGNGGLGRLAACFMDSLTTLHLPADGVGLCYHLGLFKQVFDWGKQTEQPNPWITPQGYLTRTEQHYPVQFKNFTLNSTLYTIDVTGYNGSKNQLKLFDVDSVDESIVYNGINFDKSNIAKNLTLFLYPDDSDENGKKLRVYQQYFMVSNAAQMILDEYTATHPTEPLTSLHEHVQIQINDTHPSMVIPELIRLLTARGVSMNDAIATVTQTCAYTNHTILAEALEKWPVHYLEEVCPQLLPIIRELDNRVSALPYNVHIIQNNTVHMANMDIHYSHSVNGVAAIHTDILKNVELKDFYNLYPNKFNNKTNGITFRRWLQSCNPELTNLLTDTISDEFLQDASLLTDLQGKDIQQKLLTVKQVKKNQLATYLQSTQGIQINPNSILDIQIKRLHEYKRQQMNALYIIYKYLDIKSGNKPSTPITILFGAKAAPAYTMAKNIIHLIVALGNMIKSDPDVASYLQVVMVENYNVTLAEKLIPAADISEQISLASKEASGTGNMKFMLNGAVTIGTDDGANVEIHNLVGDDNIYIFGAKSDEVIQHYQRHDYHPRNLYNADADIRKVVDFLTNPTLTRHADPAVLQQVQNDLLSKDYFMALLDFKDYCKTKDKMLADYEDRSAWANKMLVNIAQAGYFSSDRTIAEYNKDIWHLEPDTKKQG
jgi:starch phosphorylase